MRREWPAPAHRSARPDAAPGRAESHRRQAPPRSLQPSPGPVDGRSSRYSEPPVRQPKGAGGFLWIPLGALGLVVVVGACAFLLGIGRFSDTGQSESGDAIGSAVAPDDAGSASEDINPLVEAPEAPSRALPIDVPTSGPFVRFDWDGRALTIGGTVPDEALADQLRADAAEVYPDGQVQVETVVDPSTGPAPDWMSSTPQIGSRIHLLAEATAIVADGRIQLTGRARAADDVTFVDALLAEASGLPVEIRGVEISSLRAAVWFVSREEGTITLTGGLPDEEYRQGFIRAASAQFGADNLVDNSSLDRTAESALWMHEPDRLLEAFSGFTEYELQFGGEQFRFQLGGGPSFETGSTEISPEQQAALDYLADLMVRQPTMSVEIGGHTDATGSSETNQRLSQERATAAGDYLVGQGVEAERINAIGYGASRPIASNDTEDGRAQNRRTELTLTRTPLGY